MIWFATFRGGQPLASHYVRLVADSWYSAREVMDLMYPGTWQRLYDSEEPAQRASLTEVPFGTLNLEVS